jgi:hypothetical protein
VLDTWTGSAVPADTGSGLNAGLIPITIPELLRLLRDTVIPPPRRDRPHRLHWSTCAAATSTAPANAGTPTPRRRHDHNELQLPYQFGASTGTQAGYADAGEVMSLGPVASFGGITAKGSANLSENIWITDGSEATVPGTHQLSRPVDFSYGLQQPGDTYYMDSGPSGRVLDVDAIKAMCV